MGSTEARSEGEVLKLPEMMHWNLDINWCFIISRKAQKVNIAMEE